MEQHAANTKIHWIKLISCIVLCQAAGLTGLLFTDVSSGSWYQNLNKPSFNPPSYVFGPVWTILYLMMAISLYIVLQQPTSSLRRKGLNFFYIQLVLNALWTIIFFGLEQPLGGLICILLLLIAILLTILQFHNISRLAALLLYPYILWVSFATLLNYSLYILN